MKPVNSTAVPHHVAIVMDGNGRWATKRFLPRIAGHKQGVDALRTCVQTSVNRGIAVLTVFAFSSENWNRPADEVNPFPATRAQYHTPTEQVNNFTQNHERLFASQGSCVQREQGGHTT